MSWNETDREDTTVYKVVVNHEEQYSIWPADRENALGWNDAGKSGPKAECLAYIKEVWTDQRPLSLRKQMAEAASREATDDAAGAEAEHHEEEDLVTRLSKAASPVEVSLRPERSVQALKERLDRGYVHLKFTATRGGTELGVKLDPEALDLEGADFEAQTGTVRLEGGMTLNYEQVRCVAEINLETLAGQGRLERA
nr:mbtH-like protein [uncultured bacterium]